jgi:prepilin-type N-terminal cleavage/methylation domain-containing protein
MYNYKAFTLIELMVVICLIALLAGMGVMQFSFLDATITHAELDKLMTACLYMQQLAIATNEEKQLLFDINKHEYRFEKFYEKLSPRVRFGFLSGVKGPPGSPTHIIEKAITFPSARICFYPTGIISSGTVYLVDAKKHCLYALSNAVSHVSFLRLYIYKNGTWQLCGDNKK